VQLPAEGKGRILFLPFSRANPRNNLGFKIKRESSFVRGLPLSVKVKIGLKDSLTSRILRYHNREVGKREY